MRATDRQAGIQYNGNRLPQTKQSPEEILNQIKALTITYGHAGPRDVPFKFATQDLVGKQLLKMDNTASRLSGQLWEVTNQDSITYSVIREHVEVYDYDVHIWNIGCEAARKGLQVQGESQAKRAAREAERTHLLAAIDDHTDRIATKLKAMIESYRQGGAAVAVYRPRLDHDFNRAQVHANKARSTSRTDSPHDQTPAVDLPVVSSLMPSSCHTSTSIQTSAKTS